MVNLDWRTLVPSREPTFWVKGTEIECALVPGYYSRFMVYAVRTLIPADPNPAGVRYHADQRFRLRDASTVSDADSRAGKRPEIVYEAATLDECLQWCKDNTNYEGTDQ